MATGIVFAAVGLDLDDPPTSPTYDQHLVQQRRCHLEHWALIEVLSEIAHQADRSANCEVPPWTSRFDW